MIESGGEYALLINDSDVFFLFDLTTRSSSLKKQNYTDYQQFLYDTILEKLDKGMNYKEIVEWLNDNVYKTVRGSKFKNNHTHSIVKKKKLNNYRHTKTFPFYSVLINQLFVRFLKGNFNDDKGFYTSFF